VIPQPYITEWSTHASWPSESQIEQDLILSRLIIEIASDELLANELTFRGGTCLHKLHLPQAARYSEDLDYTRTSEEPKIGECLTALRRIAANIGLEERKRRFPSHDSDMACIWFRTNSETNDGEISIKIEINIHETGPEPANSDGRSRRRWRISGCRSSSRTRRGRSPLAFRPASRP
jgi:hypothetical protein